MTSIAIARPLTVRASELTDGTPRRTVIPHFQLTSKVELSGGRQFLHRRDALLMWHRGPAWHPAFLRSEEHTSELQSLMRISYAVFCLKKKKTYINNTVN